MQQFLCANSSFTSATRQQFQQIPPPPTPCKIFKDFLVYSDEQLSDLRLQYQLQDSLHTHYQQSAGGRKFLYVHAPEYQLTSHFNNSNNVKKDVDSTFCLLQQNVRAGDHKCTRVLLWIQGTKIDKFSTYRSPGFGSLHVNIPPPVQAFIQLLNEKFLVSREDTSSLKVRCELDDSGFARWTTEDIHYCDSDEEEQHLVEGVEVDRFTEIPQRTEKCDESILAEKKKATDSNQNTHIPHKKEKEIAPSHTAYQIVINSKDVNSGALEFSLQGSDVDESFVSAVKKKKGKNKKISENISDPPGTVGDNVTFPPYVDEEAAPQDPSASANRLDDNWSFRRSVSFSQKNHWSLSNHSNKETLEEIHFPPALSPDADPFEYIKPICVPHETKVDVLLHLNHVSPYRSQNSLIISLINLRISHLPSRFPSPDNNLVPYSVPTSQYFSPLSSHLPGSNNSMTSEQLVRSNQIKTSTQNSLFRCVPSYPSNSSINSPQIDYPCNQRNIQKFQSIQSQNIPCPSQASQKIPYYRDSSAQALANETAMGASSNKVSSLPHTASSSSHSSSENHSSKNTGVTASTPPGFPPPSYLSSLSTVHNIESSEVTKPPTTITIDQCLPQMDSISTSHNHLFSHGISHENNIIAASEIDSGIQPPPSVNIYSPPRRQSQPAAYWERLYGSITTLMEKRHSHSSCSESAYESRKPSFSKNTVGIMSSHRSLRSLGGYSISSEGAGLDCSPLEQQPFLLHRHKLDSSIEMHHSHNNNHQHSWSSDKISACLPPQHLSSSASVFRKAYSDTEFDANEISSVETRLAGSHERENSLSRNVTSRSYSFAQPSGSTVTSSNQLTSSGLDAMNQVRQQHGSLIYLLKQRYLSQTENYNISETHYARNQGSISGLDHQGQDDSNDEGKSLYCSTLTVDGQSSVSSSSRLLGLHPHSHDGLFSHYTGDNHDDSIASSHDHYRQYRQSVTTVGASIPSTSSHGRFSSSLEPTQSSDRDSTSISNTAANTRSDMSPSNVNCSPQQHNAAKTDPTADSACEDTLERLDDVPEFGNLPRMHPRNVKRRRVIQDRLLRSKSSAESRDIHSSLPTFISPCDPRISSTLSIDDKRNINSDLCKQSPAAQGETATPSSDLAPITTTSSSAMEPQTTGASELEYFYSIGDLVQIVTRGDRKDLHDGQIGEILSINISPETQHPIASLHLCRTDGKRQRLQPQSGVKENIPITNIRLYEKAQDRSEQKMTSTLYRPVPDSHNMRTDVPTSAVEYYPAASAGDNSMGAFKQQLVATPFSLAAPKTTSGVLCFFWDLEATGLDVNNDDITQIACVCRRFYFSSNNENDHGRKSSKTNTSPQAYLNDGNDDIMTKKGFPPLSVETSSSSSTLGSEISPASGCWEIVDGYPEKEFNRYVFTNRVVPKPVVELTGITNEFLNEFGVSFYHALLDWKQWILSTQRDHENCPIWFVAHNGNRYDLPLLFQQEAKLGHTPGTFLKSIGVVGLVDTVILSRRLQWGDGPRRSHKLQTLYYDIFHYHMPNEHDALGDVTGLAALMGEAPFLNAWKNETVGWNLEQYLFDGHYSSPSSYPTRAEYLNQVQQEEETMMEKELTCTSGTTYFTTNRDGATANHHGASLLPLEQQHIGLLAFDGHTDGPDVTSSMIDCSEWATYEQQPTTTTAFLNYDEMSVVDGHYHQFHNIQAERPIVAKRMTDEQSKQRLSRQRLPTPSTSIAESSSYCTSERGVLPITGPPPYPAPKSEHQFYPKCELNLASKDQRSIDISTSPTFRLSEFPSVAGRLPFPLPESSGVHRSRSATDDESPEPERSYDRARYIENELTIKPKYSETQFVDTSTPEYQESHHIYNEMSDVGIADNLCRPITSTSRAKSGAHSQPIHRDDLFMHENFKSSPLGDRYYTGLGYLDHQFLSLPSHKQSENFPDLNIYQSERDPRYSALSQQPYYTVSYGSPISHARGKYEDKMPRGSSRLMSEELSEVETPSPSTGFPYKSSPEPFRPRPGDLPPALPCPGRATISQRPQLKTTTSSQMHDTELSTSQYASVSGLRNEWRPGDSSSTKISPSVNDEDSFKRKHLRDGLDLKEPETSTKSQQHSLLVPPYPPPPPTPETTSMTSPSLPPGSAWFRGTQNGGIWKPAASPQPATQPVAKAAASLPPPRSVKAWGARPSTSTFSSDLDFGRKLTTEESSEDIRKPQAKQIMKRSPNTTVGPSPAHNESSSRHRSSTESLSTYQQRTEVVRGRNNNRKPERSPEWRSDAQPDEAHRRIGFSKQSITISQSSHNVREISSRQLQGIWTSQRGSDKAVNGDDTSQAATERYRNEPPRGFSLYSDMGYRESDRETKEVQRPSPQKLCTKNYHEREQLSDDNKADIRSEGGRRGAPMKHVKILKRSDTRKSKAEEIALQLMFNNYEGSSDTYKSSKSTPTATTPPAPKTMWKQVGPSAQWEERGNNQQRRNR